MKSHKLQNHRKRVDIVYSTNPNFQYQEEEQEEAVTKEPAQQPLKVLADRSMRRGKTVTLVRGFIGRDEDLEELSKKLKIKCGVGGSTKEGEIIIQGEFVDKVVALLKEMGYAKAKRL